jgi:two-component system, OmpR family, sensor kinase
VKSIRAKLVLSLIVALTAGLILALVGTYILTRKQVGTMFDEELRQVALVVHLREDWIQQKRVRIARPGFFLAVRAYDKNGRLYFETALPSLPPDLPQTYGEGFGRIDTTEGPWRIFTHVTDEGIVQVGQPVGTRDALARDVSSRALVPMLLLIPFLALALGWVFRRGLAPLQDTSKRVSDRDASRLDPLPIENVPTELLPLVQQINALLERLSKSLDADRRFLADAAHELRSPMAALALQAQLAERAASPATRAEAFRELSRGIERGRRLIQQLLDFARLEPGVTALPFAPVDMARVARHVVGSAAARAEALGVDLGAEAAAPAYVLGSEPELRSLVENVVDNALRYAPRETAVTVSVRNNAGEVEIHIVDAGPGIDPAEREKVFHRFHRVPGDSTAGSGLGLSIVKAIVEHHQGHISLEDAMPGSDGPGLGVRISLPAASRLDLPASDLRVA